MIKNIIVTLLIAALISFGTYKIAINNPGHLILKKETTYDRVLRTGTLRCGYGMWPPVMLTKDPNSGKLSGALVDIIEQAAKNLSLKVEWTEETGWGSWVEGLKTHRFDVFCGAPFQNAARGREARFTIPLFYSAVYGYARTDDHRFDQGLANLNSPEFKISTVDGEITALVAQQFFPKAKTVSLPQLSNLDQVFMNIVDKKADIIFIDPSIIGDFIKKNPGKLKRVTPLPVQVLNSAFPVAMDEANLAAMLNSALTELQNNGIINQILTKDGADNATFLRIAKPYQ